MHAWSVGIRPSGEYKFSLVNEVILSYLPHTVDTFLAYNADVILKLPV